MFDKIIAGNINTVVKYYIFKNIKGGSLKWPIIPIEHVEKFRHRCSILTNLLINLVYRLSYLKSQ